MKPARVVILLVALAPGCPSVLLAGRSEPPTPVTQALPLATVGVPTISSDIALGSTSGVEVIVRFGVTT